MLVIKKISELGCGDPECSVSTNILDTLTFGKGELDHNGFWEFPCEKCYVAFIKANCGADSAY